MKYGKGKKNAGSLIVRCKNAGDKNERILPAVTLA